VTAPPQDEDPAEIEPGRDDQHASAVGSTLQVLRKTGMDGVATPCLVRAAGRHRAHRCGAAAVGRDDATPGGYARDEDLA
jgi:hypothetical protein